MSEYRRLLAERQNANGALPPQTPAPGQTSGQHRARTRNPNSPGGSHPARFPDECRRVSPGDPCGGWRPCPSWTGWSWPPSPASPTARPTTPSPPWSAQGLVASLPHATTMLRRTRRYFLTNAGLRRLADDRGHYPRTAFAPPPGQRPVAAHPAGTAGRRGRHLPGSPPPSPSVEGIASFRWYRGLPLDAGIVLNDGRTIGVIRQGLTADRTGFAKRIWRLREGPPPGGVLLLLPDEVRMRHARRLVAAVPFPTLLALERNAAWCGPDQSCLAASFRQRCAGLESGPGPHPRERRIAGGAAAVAGDTAPRHRARLRRGERTGLAPARPAETRREAGPGPGFRLALDCPTAPPVVDGRFPETAVPGPLATGRRRAG